MKMYIMSNESIRHLLDSEKEQFLDDYREMNGGEQEQAFNSLLRWAESLNCDTTGVYGETDEEVIEQYWDLIMSRSSYEVEVLYNGDTFLYVIGANGNTFGLLLGNKDELEFIDY